MAAENKPTNWAPPLLIVAAPAGTYTFIRLGPEQGWATSGLAALAVLLLVLALPGLLKAGAKAGRAKAAKKTPPAKK
ncbi:hypothetical protein [Streptomyces sp. URMC 129]|uniref:hypothetical protein n=1 Tax=Streptomyces sp. URMC 129 TaxID=3423407 RepID=UPI003F19C869